MNVPVTLIAAILLSISATAQDKVKEAVFPDAYEYSSRLECQKSIKGKLGEFTAGALQFLPVEGVIRVSVNVPGLKGEELVEYDFFIEKREETIGSITTKNDYYYSLMELVFKNKKLMVQKKPSQEIHPYTERASSPGAYMGKAQVLKLTEDRVVISKHQEFFLGQDPQVRKEPTTYICKIRNPMTSKGFDKLRNDINAEVTLGGR